MQTFNNFIQKSLSELMHADSQILLLGLGVTDPKRFFGTTNNLLETFGPERVLECPTSENAYLGHAFGLALSGYSPIVHFQRMDFMLYAFDQLVNNIAKWKDMFNYQVPTNLVVRTLVGMGWGQGAQHAQNLAPLLAQIPGLKVLTPSCPTSAAQLLKLATKDGSPIIFTEHRWLQNLQQSESYSIDFNWEIGKACVRKTGNDFTIVTWSYGTVEALRFQELFPELDIEIIDLLSLSPLDINSILISFKKNKKLVIWEPAIGFAGIGAEISAQINDHGLSGTILRLGYSHSNLSSSPLHINNFYLSLDTVVQKINSTLNLNLIVPETALEKWPHDKENNLWSPWK